MQIRSNAINNIMKASSAEGGWSRAHGLWYFRSTNSEMQAAARFIVKRATGSWVLSERQAAGVRALRNAMQAAKKRQ